MIFGKPAQLGYVTADLDKACELLTSRVGITEFLRPEITVSANQDGEEMQMRIAHAFWGDTWYEIIQPIGGAVDLYRVLLPEVGLRLHHLGIMIDGLEEYEQALSAQRAAGRTIAMSMSYPGVVSLFYVDTLAEFGHYTEYTHYADPNGPLITRIPRNLPK